jgi:acetyl-CoA acetyltransferase
VNNNCATGSTAIYVAHEMISGGRVSCALALGFDRMEPGSLGMKYHDRTNPLDKIFINTLEITQKSDPAPFAPQVTFIKRGKFISYGKFNFLFVLKITNNFIS